MQQGNRYFTHVEAWNSFSGLGAEKQWRFKAWISGKIKPGTHYSSFPLGRTKINGQLRFEPLYYVELVQRSPPLNCCVLTGGDRCCAPPHPPRTLQSALSWLRALIWSRRLLVFPVCLSDRSRPNNFFFDLANVSRHSACLYRA